MPQPENTVYVGSPENPKYTLRNENILSVSGDISCKMVATEMPVDYIEVEFRISPDEQFYTVFGEEFRTASDQGLYTARMPVRNVPHDTDVWLYRDTDCTAHMFLSEVRQVGKDTFRMRAEGFLAVLERYDRSFSKHTGSLSLALRRLILYDGAGGGFSEDPILNKIMSMIWYEDGIRDAEFDCILPSGNRRKCLMELLLSRGLIIRPQAGGTYLICHGKSSNNPLEILAENVYEGSSVVNEAPVDRVEITVHNFVYISSDPSEEIYITPDDAAYSRRRIFFDAPVEINTIQAADGLTIVSSGTGGAIVEGRGRLMGKKYRHRTWVVARGVPESEATNVVRVTDDVAIGPDLGGKIADNLWNYYSAGEIVEQDIVSNGETCGMQYQIVNPFWDAQKAYLEQMRFDGSGIIKAACKFRTNYIPPEDEDVFMNSVLLTGSGVWKPPESLFDREHPRISVTLIGGGTGGSSGLKGPDGAKAKQVGTDPSDMEGLGYREGGKAGACGLGGNIYTEIIAGNDLKRSYNYSCGAGGAGGGICYDEKVSNPGQPGTETTFGALSSGMGDKNRFGTIDPSNGRVYGGCVDEYVASGLLKYISVNGGHSTYFHLFDGNWLAMSAMSAVYDQYINANIDMDPVQGLYILQGGNAGMAMNFRVSGYSGSMTFPGGLGGGFACTEYGQVGQPAKQNSDGTVISGDGGNGANATAPGFSPLQYDKYYYGFGGFGGHGGGAGGDAGPTRQGYPKHQTSGTPGVGGYGGSGGDGAPGAILILY